MNYYPFHIGDYLSATRHLSWEEDAAFRRLLDTYYTTEKPLPTDHRAVCRLVLATTDSQREAVRVVLEEFFEATPEGWVNRRADVEIAAMREKQEKQRAKANKRWNKPRAEHGTASAMPQHEESDAAASKVDADAMPPTPTPTPTKSKEQKLTPSASPTAELPPLPDWIDSEAWSGFVAMRRRERHPLTPRAAKLVLTELAKLRDAGQSPNDVLDQSVRNGWRDVYPLKDQTNANRINGGSVRNLSVVERIEQSIAERKQREAAKAVAVVAG